MLCLLLQGQSKLCNVLFMRELNKRLQAEGAPVVTVACHPGTCAASLNQNVLHTLRPWNNNKIRSAADIICASP